jgi:hypothetical protein
VLTEGRNKSAEVRVIEEVDVIVDDIKGWLAADERIELRPEVV